mmetsp:Transcript_6621/g.18051  ORF Transcript_6621/g.18051 Transcript_6621/m.18051 type:complete len:219 (-) Transcript_6621:77-733(-)
MMLQCCGNSSTHARSIAFSNALNLQAYTDDHLKNYCPRLSLPRGSAHTSTACKSALPPHIHHLLYPPRPHSESFVDCVRGWAPPSAPAAANLTAATAWFSSRSSGSEPTALAFIAFASLRCLARRCVFDTVTKAAPPSPAARASSEPRVPAGPSLLAPLDSRAPAAWEPTEDSPRSVLALATLEETPGSELGRLGSCRGSFQGELQSRKVFFVVSSLL